MPPLLVDRNVSSVIVGGLRAWGRPCARDLWGGAQQEQERQEQEEGLEGRRHVPVRPARRHRGCGGGWWWVGLLPWRRLVSSLAPSERALCVVVR